jgi:predicted Rossmann fold nucleotide-binding protein DprA/Smf involved in DNA uptake
MKIAITIELDKESAEIFQTPFKKLSKQINDLIGMFKKVDYEVEGTPALVPETKPTKSAAKKPKKKPRPKISVKATILKTIKNHEGGINSKDLQQQTGLTGKQISNNLFHLKKDKKVEKTEGGLFIAI